MTGQPDLSARIEALLAAAQGCPSCDGHDKFAPCTCWGAVGTIKTLAPAALQSVAELVRALVWALSELPVPHYQSDPEYGMRHETARDALRATEERLRGRLG